ncbi:hypothetical protein BVC93_32235 (plasmid) [Mycobacterium sp. MS1601]|nr:hypothetical protein BVC93_32235 [Mycobacterium sp. MS1601]
MGEVYLVRHPRLPRHEALKVLRGDWSADADFRARFVREADMAAGLSHPHIVGVHDRGEYDGRLWISMEYIEGTDLLALLRDRYPHGLPLPEVAAIVSAIADALDYAHHRGLLHRDIKPANILLSNADERGARRILLTDFGIARTTGDVSGLTATNMTVGTVTYSAPEQLLGEAIDGRADQYALAATAFHLLTGTRMFPHSNPVAVISAHLHTAPPLPGQRRADLAALDPVFATALAKNPQHRFPSCREFAHHLSATLYHLAEHSSPTQHATPIPAAAPPPSPQPGLPPAPRPRPTRRRGRLAAGVAAAVAVVVAVVAGFVFISGDTEPTAQELAHQDAARTVGQQYLEALAAGDAHAALDLVVTAPADTRFLTDDVLASQLNAAPISQISVTSAPAKPGDDPAQVQQVLLAATFGGQRSQVQIGVEHHGDRWLLPRITADVAVANPGSPLLGVTTVWDIPLGGSPTATLFPGAVSVGSSINAVDITADAPPLLLDRLLPPGRAAITPEVTLTDTGRMEADSAVTFWAFKCYSGNTSGIGCPDIGRTPDNTPPNIVPGTTKITGAGDLRPVNTEFDAQRLTLTYSGGPAQFPAEGQATSGSPTYTIPFQVNGTVDLTKAPPMLFTVAS